MDALIINWDKILTYAFPPKFPDSKNISQTKAFCMHPSVLVDPFQGWGGICVNRFLDDVLDGRRKPALYPNPKQLGLCGIIKVALWWRSLAIWQLYILHCEWQKSQYSERLVTGATERLRILKLICLSYDRFISHLAETRRLAFSSINGM